MLLNAGRGASVRPSTCSSRLVFRPRRPAGPASALSALSGIARACAARLATGRLPLHRAMAVGLLVLAALAAVPQNASAAPCAADPAPREAFWSTCVTVANISGSYGYIRSPAFGAVSEQSVTLGDTQFLLESIISSSTGLSVQVSPARNVSNHWAVQVGNNPSSPGTASYSTQQAKTTFEWSNSGFSWGSGDVGNKFTLSLIHIGPAPELASATIQSNRIKLDYTTALNGSLVPDPGDFTVNVVGGSRIPVSSVYMDGGRLVILKLPDRVASTDSVQLTYRPGARPIRSVAINPQKTGNAGRNAPALTNHALTNITPPEDLIVTSAGGHLDDRHCVDVRCWAMDMVEGAEETFEVRLAAQPSKSRRMVIDAYPLKSFEVSPGVLTFTRSNWDTAQRVTVRATLDDDADEHVLLDLVGSGRAFFQRSLRFFETVASSGVLRLVTHGIVYVDVEDDNSAGACAGHTPPSNAFWVACLTTVHHPGTNIWGFNKDTALGGLNREGLRTSQAHGNNRYAIVYLVSNFASNSNTTALILEGDALSQKARNELTLHVGASSLALSSASYEDFDERRLLTWNNVTVSDLQTAGNQVTIALVDSTGLSRSVLKPGPPVVSATPGAGRVTLNWAAPEYDGTITGWQVRRGEVDAGDGSIAWSEWIAVEGATAETASHTVRALEADIWYGFQVRARAGAVRGEASVPMLLMPEPVLPAPTNLAAEIGGGQVTLTWTAPEFGEPITAWQVRRGGTRSHDGRVEWDEWRYIEGATAETASHVVTNLLPGVTHRLEVRALSGGVIGAAAGIEAAMPAVSADEDGALRLTGGPSSSHGRLEVFHAGRWGGVCNDLFTQPDATVACRQLGYEAGEARRSERRPLAGGMSFWLDNLKCTGEEAALGLCRHNGWGVHNCRPEEAVSVSCTGPLAPPAADLAPGAPPDLAATVVSDNSATLTWTLPAQPGGGYVDEMHLERLDAEGGVAWSERVAEEPDAETAWERRVDGLDAGAAYRFRVRLVMESGATKYSAVADVTTETEPSLGPEGLAVTASRSGAVSLAWTIPEQPSWVTATEGTYVKVLREMTAPATEPEQEVGQVDWTRGETAYTFTDESVFAGRHYRYRIEAAVGERLHTSAWAEAQTPVATTDPDASPAGATALDVAQALQKPWYLRGLRLDRAGGDAVDYYRFTLTARQELGLGVRGQRIDLDAFVEDATGTRLGQSWPPPGNPSIEWLKIVLDPGTYYIRVEARADRATGYYLRFGLKDPPASASVADARAEEGVDATLDFVVTLDRQADRTVTVDYATADGTATAGEDYTATAGTLRFAAGETSQTIAVPVLDDVLDEGEETLTLRLTNPQGGALLDGDATGTIANSDPLQQAWLARFGRTVATHVTDAVGERRRTRGNQDEKKCYPCIRYICNP